MQYEGHPGYLPIRRLETFPQDRADFAWKSFNGGWNEIIGKMLPDFWRLVAAQFSIRRTGFNKF